MNLFYSASLDQSVALKNLLMGFLESVMRFATASSELLLTSSRATLFPKWVVDILNTFHAPEWLIAFSSANWFVNLITTLFGGTLLSILIYKIIMRLIQLLNPLN